MSRAAFQLNMTGAFFDVPYHKRTPMVKTSNCPKRSRSLSQDKVRFEKTLQCIADAIGTDEVDGSYWCTSFIDTSPNYIAQMLIRKWREELPVW